MFLMSEGPHVDARERSIPDARVHLESGAGRPRESYRGTSLIRDSNPPYNHHRALGMGLL